MKLIILITMQAQNSSSGSLKAKIIKLYNKESGEKIYSKLVGDGIDLSQFDHMDDQTLRETLEIFGFLQVNQSKISRKQIEKSKSSQDSTKKKSQLQNPEHPIEKISPHKKDVESLGLEYYFSEMKKFMDEYQQFFNYMSPQDIKLFMEYWSKYQQQEPLTVGSLKKKVDGFWNELLKVDSALYHSSPKHRLRPTQALAIYCFLHNPNAKKIILQIKTGEGKSITISCIAAILRFRNRIVDIVTTNEILARRDVEEMAKFYNLLGINVSHNFSTIVNEPKECYGENTIVYGTSHSFQVDLLYNDYYKKNTRNSRPYQVGIIDESDSLFVDEKEHQTLLSSTYTGFSQLHAPMRLIWQQIVTENFQIDDGNKIKMFSYGQSENEIIESDAKLVMEQIVKKVRERYKNEIIPTWRKEFVDLSLEGWIMSALHAAYFYKEQVHYVIKDGNIVPIDHSNTGCLQNNVQWQNGLHQFLQMKHGLDITTQSMTSNFISNIGYFNRYQSLFGVTGTLGSEQSKKFLHQTYETQLLEIPSYQKRILENEPGKLMYSIDQWFNCIQKRTSQMMENQRSCLIICESIQLVKSLEKGFKESGRNFRSILTLTTGEEVYHSTVDCQEIIIATNIAGRGTDLKITERLKQRGGLHVIITFVPQNKRVQMQARGRAGRNGAPGSSEVIACYQQYCKSNNMLLMDRSVFMENNLENRIENFFQNTRDLYESQKMEKDLEVVENLKTKDKVFFQYCEAVNKLPDFQQNRALRSAIQERWALFLKKMEVQKLPNQKIESEASKVINNLTNNPEGHYNPNHSVQRGIHAMLNGDKKVAQKHFNFAQNSETNLTCRISAEMLGSANQINLDPKNQQNVQLSLKKLATIDSLIEERKDMVQAVHAISESVSNQKIVEHMEQQKIQEDNKLQESFGKGQKEQMHKGEKKKYKEFHQDSKEKLEKKKAEKIMDITEIKILDNIKQHLKEQMQKYKQLKKGEWIQFNYEPISTLIQTTPGKQKQQEKVLQKLRGDGLELLPKATIKKKKTPWWKRALIFCFGVLQICIGALILSAGSANLASFGTSMITRGVQSCFDALFNPQICNDLRKYFSDKALEYTIDLVMLGKNGIKQLKELGGKGFSVIKNKSMKEIMEQASKGISEGLKKYATQSGHKNFEHIIKKQIFEGIKQKQEEKGANKELLKKMNEQKFEKVMKNPKLQGYVKEGIKESNKIEALSQQNRKIFHESLEKRLNQIACAELPNIIDQIPQLDSSNLQILIHNCFIKNFHTCFDPSRNKQLYKNICLFMSMHLKNKTAGSLFLMNFKLDKKLIQTIRKIPQAKQLGDCFKNEWKVRILTKMQDIRNNKVTEANQCVSWINNNQQTADRATIDQQKNRLKLFTRDIEETDKKMKYYQQNIQSQLEKLRTRKILLGAKITKDKALLRQVSRQNDFLYETLRALESQKGNRDETTNKMLSFIVEKAKQPISGITEKAIDEIIGASSKSPETLLEIQKKLNQELLA